MKQRSAALDFWKFVFSLIIVFYHSWYLADNFKPLASGYLGVEFFFIVSGALMAASAERRRSKPEQPVSLGKETMLFIRHKIGGLLPNYYVGWVFAFLVTHLVARDGIKSIVLSLIKSVPELTFTSELGFRFPYANSACWYLSAMLIAMALLYPLLRKTGEGFYACWAPLIVLALMGITFMQLDCLNPPHSKMFGLLYRGMVRAVMEVSLGCICYRVSAALSALKPTKLSVSLLTVVEAGSFAAALLKMWRIPGDKLDWIVVVLLAVGVTVTLSGQSGSARLFSGSIFTKLGVFSYSLYLSHGYWCHLVPKLIRSSSTGVLLAAYLAVSLATALAVHFISLGLRKWWKQHGSSVKALFIKTA